MEERIKNSHKKFGDIFKKVEEDLVKGFPVYKTLKKINYTTTMFYKKISFEQKRRLQEIRTLKRKTQKWNMGFLVLNDSADYYCID